MDGGVMPDDIEGLRHVLYDALMYVAEDMRTPAHWMNAIIACDDRVERRSLVKRWSLYQAIQRAMDGLPELETGR